MSHRGLISFLLLWGASTPVWAAGTARWAAGTTVAGEASGRVASVAARRFEATLDPFEEVPAISSDAQGWIVLEVEPGGDVLRYELRYEGLEGRVSQAHLHFGQAGVNGGVLAWLCGTADAPGPADTPDCPDGGGVVSGKLSAGEVTGATAQGVPPGGFQALLQALRAGLVYANVHSSAFPGGEARGQLRGPRQGAAR
ncbi:MAG: CHRD domain-containing protein [Steroidobacteraceae bacterium]|jgi:hypothetical protein|nr:CHRD domain-containing protein [Steroidobacteraceae bacterium]